LKQDLGTKIYGAKLGASDDGAKVPNTSLPPLHQRSCGMGAWRQGVLALCQWPWHQALGLDYEIKPPGAYLRESFKKG